MYRFSRILASACLASGLLFASQNAHAVSGSNAIAQAKTADGAVSRCAATKQGQAVIDCVGDAMSRLASNVNRGEVPTKAPEILSMAREAATIRGKPKAEALRVLQRLAGVARGLAAKTKGDFGPAYNAVGGVFTRAVSAIERKG